MKIISDIKKKSGVPKQMKIVAGLGSIDEYIRFVKAGADEFFCGYVPYSWSKKYGTVMPLNRREVLCYNVQIGSFSELEILSEMIKKYKKPVHLTFNSLYYLPDQYQEIADIIRQCMSLGFQSYIIADPALMVYLREQGISCEIHLSGETGEINSQMLKAFQKLGLKRVIFHRKNTFEDMKTVIHECGRREGSEAEKLRENQKENPKEKSSKKIPEFEAFVLNELCQFSGAFCNSLHCDELGYLCTVPYELGTREEAKGEAKEKAKEEKKKEKNGEISERYVEEQCVKAQYIRDETGYLCGETGCGLCALYQLRQAGITHLKLVGRGNYVDYMEKDIRNLKKALKILESVDSEKTFSSEKACGSEKSFNPEKTFISRLKTELFPAGCSNNCYYIK